MRSLMHSSLSFMRKGAADMSELTLSIVIILITGAAVAVVFLFIGNRKKKKEQALADFCRERGYAFSRTKEPLGVVVRVEGEAFSLTSKMLAQRLDAQFGTSSWTKETVWMAKAVNGGLPGYTLGSVSAGGDWSALPAWIKDAAVKKLADETGLSLDPVRARAVCTKGKACFLLFEEKPGAGSAALQRLEPLLELWIEQFNLVISSGPQGLVIRAAGLFIEDVTQLECMLRLGEACLG